MKNREQELRGALSSTEGHVFRVWVDEDGRPRLPEELHRAIPEEFFVRVSAQESAACRPFLLLSGPEGLFFARSASRPDRYRPLSESREYPLDFPVILLGGVVSGTEWFTVDA